MADITETVAELRRLEAEATAGEWDPAECGPGRNIPEIIACDGDGDWVPICYFDTHDNGAPADNLEANRKLIVAMRNALPALLDYIERMQEAVIAEVGKDFGHATGQHEGALHKITFPMHDRTNAGLLVASINRLRDALRGERKTND